ncbi:YciI family protein [Actinoplanes sp. TRM 88003]|uniref:YciI family protein n=1 Tax=Paractinoplanes aksuensis TaxID=2939490 RepID=A0ABT1DWD5_9ACTN|nr:YciI family protein [Actinoplanes aksuensis]MCO8273956.1 YciI family protein [Actinoplanes aksuensis]
MDYFFYGRDRDDSAELRQRLVEAHWSFMDRYADGMIARGPTLTDDRERATGSVHIVELPDAETAHVFAFDEPNYRAGVYRHVTIRRYVDLLGRTMWDFPGGRAERFLILAHARPLMDWPGAERTEPALDRDRLIAFGRLLSSDGEDWEGTVVIGEFDDPARIRDLLALTGAYDKIETHRWTFGGRR